MTPFGTAMRQYIRRGLSPASAMRSAWTDVRRGRVAQPPRGGRRQSTRTRGNPWVVEARPERARIVKSRRAATQLARRENSSPGWQDPARWGPTYISAEYARAIRSSQRRGRNPRSGWFDYTAPGDGRFTITPVGNSSGKTIAYQLAHSPGVSGPTRAVGPYFTRPGPARRYASRWASARGIRVPANAPPPVSRVGQLVAQVYQRSGVHSLAQLEAIADAHAQVYRVPRGDVYEYARRWLGRHTLRGRNPAPRYFKRPGGVRLDVIGRDPRAPGVFIATRDDAPEGMVYAVRSRAGRVVSVSPVTRSRKTLRQEYQRGPRHNPGGTPVLIYDRILKIYARKGRGPHHGQRFVHNFRTSARMLGLPNGDLLITGR